MRPMNMKNATSKTQLFLALVVAVTLLLAPAAFAAAPGITGTGSVGTFNLTAQDAYLNMPDGEAIYSWGYGCASGSTPTFDPPATFKFQPSCNTMQVPGPTLIVAEGTPVTINLTNNLPTAAGNTSILFPGFVLTSTCNNNATNPQGLLACEAAPGQTITYTFVASTVGTHAYYSGTQGDLQIEMGLYGAIIVLPTTPGGTAGCAQGVTNLYGLADYGTSNGVPGFPEQDFRLRNPSTNTFGAAFDHPKTCYDREYLFQWAEMDHRIHTQAQTQVQAKAGCTAGAPGCSLEIQTEPYHPAYFLINGRSMPDLMDPNYASEYPHQPYNGNPHIHPGELLLIRTIGQGRWEHPFHEHANHVRILARDGGLVLSPTNPGTSLAGHLMFNTDTTPGESFDGIFYFSGRGLNWDPYGHHPAGSGNTVTALPITAISAVANAAPAVGYTVTATVSSLIPAAVNNTTVIVAGVAPAAYNGSFTVTVPPGTATPFTITSISENGNTVTVNVSGTLPSGLTGAPVLIAGVNAVAPATTSPFNGSFSVASEPSSTQFTYINPASGLGTGTLSGATATVNLSNQFTYTDLTLTSAGSGTVSGAAATVNLGANAATPFPSDPLASQPCYPDANGYYTVKSTPPAPTSALNYYEWCQDHNKPIQKAPFGDVAGGGPATFPDPDVFTNGAWYGGSQYLGPDASLRSDHPACDTTQGVNCTDLQPANVQANPSNERGWAYMWHSHNEREITTNNVFPGGMLMMLLVDSREFAIDESQ